ncbi:hypothetical protein D3C76_1839690 [compost metagenome]
MAVQILDREGRQVIDLSFATFSAQLMSSPLARFEGIAEAYYRLAINQFLDILNAELSHGPVAQYQAPLSIVVT